MLAGLRKSADIVARSHPRRACHTDAGMVNEAALPSHNTVHQHGFVHGMLQPLSAMMDNRCRPGPTLARQYLKRALWGPSPCLNFAGFDRSI